MNQFVVKGIIVRNGNPFVRVVDTDATHGYIDIATNLVSFARLAAAGVRVIPRDQQ